MLQVLVESEWKTVVVKNKRDSPRSRVSLCSQGERQQEMKIVTVSYESTLSSFDQRERANCRSSFSKTGVFLTSLMSPFDQCERANYRTSFSKTGVFLTSRMSPLDQCERTNYRTCLSKQGGGSYLNLSNHFMLSILARSINQSSFEKLCVKFHHYLLKIF